MKTTTSKMKNQCLDGINGRFAIRQNISDIMCCPEETYFKYKDTKDKSKRMQKRLYHQSKESVSSYINIKADFRAKYIQNKGEHFMMVNSSRGHNNFVYAPNKEVQNK